MLITLYSELKHKFGDPRLKKKEVWTEIEKRMKMEKYKFSAAELSKKWSNLEQRLVIVIDDALDSGKFYNVSVWSMVLTYRSLYLGA